MSYGFDLEQHKRFVKAKEKSDREELKRVIKEVIMELKKEGFFK